MKRIPRWLALWMASFGILLIVVGVLSFPRVSYAGGTGSFAELTITDRDTLVISIDLLTEDNVAVVPRPALGSVQSAVGGLIERAAARGHKTGSSISWEENIT